MIKLSRSLRPTTNVLIISNTKSNSLAKPFTTTLDPQKFMQYASNKLNIHHMSDWYSKTNKDFLEIGGRPILQLYNFSTPKLLAGIYPSYDWLPWKFHQVPRAYWSDMKNQQKFADWAAIQLEIKNKSDWYKVSEKDIIKLGGGGLLRLCYNSSVSEMLTAVYPEYEWLPWQFEHSPRNLWRDTENLRKFLDWAGNQLGIKEKNDWYKVTVRDISNLGGANMLRTNGFSLEKVLESAYPEHNWNFKELRSKNSFFRKSQALLKTALKSVILNYEVMEEYKHPDILLGGNPLELDFYYPELNVAVEYQGQQHYRNVQRFHRFGDSLTESQRRDVQKGILCKEKGITLIEIPYWWDRKASSLAATIYSYKPDLFTEKPKGEPVPTTPPTDLREKNTNSMKDTLMTATEWEPSMDPTGWKMTEKFDGMRLYWNGSQFFTRQGKKVLVPAFLTSKMPSVPLDGELWTQYGLFQEAVNLCNVNDEEKWNKAVFWVFDAPGIAERPYEERVEYLKRLALPPFIKLVETTECKGIEHLKEFFNKIIEKGGEGIVLREPLSIYKAGRSTSLRKYKPFSDTEVKVIENNYPHGFKCKQINGEIVFVGLSNNYEAARNVREGAVITVKYLGTNTYGKLQYPKFYRERTDVKWSDLIKT